MSRARTLPPAVHRAILIVDVESFGDPSRTNAHQVAIRRRMYGALRRSFAKAHISWADCAVEDRGDGVLVLVPPTVPKSWLVTDVPVHLAEMLVRRNAACPAPERIRLRMALHAGEVLQDPHGFAATSINQAFRLIEAPALKAALHDSPGVLALIVSDWFYREVVQHDEAARPSGFRQVRAAVKETDTTAWVRVLTGHELSGRAGSGPPTSALEVRYSLPPDTAAFTGRETDLARIVAAAAGAVRGGVVAIHAIGGMPGVGKTALAVHVAHVLQDRFPDRQLYIDLQAHTPGQDPVRPEAALARLLSAVGVPARSLPADLGARADLWRDRMAGQRAVLVLDNAASSGQVTALLPGSDDCLVLITSRRHLADLPGSVTPVLVEVLPEDQAAEMFVRLAPRAAADPAETVAELVRLAGYLPLAISLLARVYNRHPAWGPADLIRETETGLLTMTAEKDSVAAAFAVSYHNLNPSQQQFFRCLGRHLGTTIDAYAAAALADIPLAEAAAYLGALYQEGLLTEVGYRRYGMHDLIRHYARDQAGADPVAERGQGLERLLEYYQQAGALAEARLARQVRTSPASAVLAYPPAAIPDLPDRAAALWWARTERANLLACLDHVTRAGQQARMVALTAALASLLRQDGPWSDAIVRHAAAVQAARQLGDRLRVANALDELGIVRRLTGDYTAAAQAHHEALDLYRDLGDRPGQASALHHLGTLWYLTDEYQQAAGALHASLAIYRDLADGEGQADTLSRLGAVLRLTHDFRGAAAVHEEALDIYRDLGDQQGQANALMYLGVVRRRTGNYRGAIQAYEATLGIQRDVGHRQGQANALMYLGSVCRETGDYQRAVQAEEEALGIYRELGSRLGQANTISELGAIRRRTGDYVGAARMQQEALGIYRSLGDRGGEALALCELGGVRRQTGDLDGAAEALERAHAIFRDLGDEAEVLNELGALYRIRGDLDRARGCHRQALDLARAVDSSWDEAHALAGLGRCALAAGQAAEATASLDQALTIFRRLGTAEAGEVAAEFAALSQAYPMAAR
jgi:tetratricopeptide (TPR) repeat protein